MLSVHGESFPANVYSMYLNTNILFPSARLLIAIRTEITDNVEITTEKNGKSISK